MRKYNPILDLYQEIDESTGGLYLAIVKAGMDCRGLRGGKVRSPLVNLNSEQRRRVEMALAEVGVEPLLMSV